MQLWENTSYRVKIVLYVKSTLFVFKKMVVGLYKPLQV